MDGIHRMQFNEEIVNNMIKIMMKNSFKSIDWKRCTCTLQANPNDRAAMQLSFSLLFAKSSLRWEYLRRLYNKKQMYSFFSYVHSRTDFISFVVPYFYVVFSSSYFSFFWNFSLFFPECTEWCGFSSEKESTNFIIIIIFSLSAMGLRNAG